MVTGHVKRWWLGTIKRTINPLAIRSARRRSGPFSVIRHIGRRSGRVFETPVVLAEAPEGLVAELTYGPEVNWYRNLCAGGGRVLHRGRWYEVAGIEGFSTEDGLRAFGGFRRAVLRMLRRTEFRLLRVRAIDDPDQGDPPADLPTRGQAAQDPPRPT